MTSMMGGVAAEVSAYDYTNTRFHTAATGMVVNHSNEQQFVLNELEKLKKGAFDKAKEEQTKKSILKA